MNGSNFFQTLESRTLFSAVPPPGLDPGALAPPKPKIQMEHALPPGGGATVDGVTGTGNGNTSGALSSNARVRFGSDLIRID